ncbi:MAG: lysine--tRNA ligase [Treponema sp.]|jgi:lysyl-tRNA synthetase class 1|nr:lysine--tRNA ligase [Treponema sp.]
MADQNATTQGATGHSATAHGATAHWADETAARIIREKGDKPSYTCASGITPSGTVHIGNFREIISVELVVRALRDMGKKVRFIYSWDDYDVFRKVPKNMPNREELEQFLRFPITMVKDPWGRDTSYARHHEVDIETVLPRLGIYPEYLYQAERYRASRYAEGIRKALEHRDALKRILDTFRDDEHKIQGEWWPVSVFCDNCNRDDTDIDRWDGEWRLSYHCNACGHRGTPDIRGAGGIKLGWRIDWPMRWEYEKVDFEPAGKDHHSHGGSFDTARHVCKDVYNWEAPVSFRYDFIGSKGSAGKMSSSSGEVITIEDVLRVYTPEVTRYLFAGTRPNTEFTISFDVDAIKIYEDYDRLERIAWKAEPAKDEGTYKRLRRIYELSQVCSSPEGKTEMPPVMAYQVPFRHLCNLIQIADGDIEKTIEGLQNTGAGVRVEQLPGLRTRCACAKYWAGECAPDEFRFRLRPPGERAELSNGEIAAVRDLRDKVVRNIEGYGDDKSCAEAVYRVAEENNLDGKILFRAAYQALIGKDQGPRLANFLRSIDRERLLGILAAY